MGILTGVKKTLDDQVKAARERGDYNRKLRKETREIYREEKLIQERGVAKERAKIEAQAKIASIRQQYKKRPSGLRGGNIAGGLYGASQGAMGFITAGLPGFQQPRPPVAKPTVHRVKKGKKGKKHRVIRPKPPQPQMQGYNWF